MYPSSQLVPTRASGGRSVAAVAASALVVSLVSMHLALLPRTTVSPMSARASRRPPACLVQPDVSAVGSK